MSETLQVDDSEQIFFGQSLELGYPIPQPPLYTWIAWSLFQFMGSSLLAVSILKYSLIFLTFIILWNVAKFYFKSKPSQYIVTLSLLLLPSFFWHMHQGFTHTILLGLAIILLLYTMLLTFNCPKTKNYIYLGIAIGIGMMSKYSFIIFAIPLLLASLSIKTYREKIINPKFIVTLLFLILVSGPHYYWIYQNFLDISNDINNKLNITSNSTINLETIFVFLKSSVGFLMPFAIVILYGLIKNNRKNKPREVLNKSNEVLLLSRFFWIIGCSIVILSLFFNMPQVKVRWLHPVLMLFPLWSMVFISSNGIISQSISRVFYYLLGVLTVLVIIVRIIQNTISPDLGYYGRLNIPISPALEHIPSYLISENVLATKDNFIGSHLLSKFQENSVLIGNKFFIRNKNSRKCLWIWSDEDKDKNFYSSVDPLTVEKNSITIFKGEFNYTLKYKLLEECSVN